MNKFMIWYSVQLYLVGCVILEYLYLQGTPTIVPGTRMAQFEHEFLFSLYSNPVLTLVKLVLLEYCTMYYSTMYIVFRVHVSCKKPYLVLE